MFLIDLKLKKCDEAVDTCPFVFASVPDRYITQELWDKVVSEDPFMLKYWHDKYKTQKCVIKLLILIFVTSNMTEKLDSAIFSDDYIVFGDLVTFFLNDISLNNINLDEDNFGYCDPESIDHFRLMDWYNKFKQRKALKKER